jgi:hypothetical protein
VFRLRATRVIHCTCCSLEQPAPRSHADGGIPRCLRCADHDGSTLADLSRRESDHARLYRRALAEAQDDVLLAQTERDFCQDKMQAAYDTRELLVRVLGEVAGLHHRRGSRCSCGKRSCRVADLVGEARIARLIRSYDEEQRTLRELRNANPDLWADSWDSIDVTLVYPTAGRRSGGGRHRATG